MDKSPTIPHARGEPFGWLIGQRPPQGEGE